MAIRKLTSTKSTSEPTYKVLEECGTISTNKGWDLKLRYMSWNNNPAKYDLRAWKEDEEGEKCGKGITLTGEELEGLLKLLQSMTQEEMAS